MTTKSERLTVGHRPSILSIAQHINGNVSDNRIENLRDATQSNNLCNKRMQSNNTSGYKGVGWHKAAGRWVARITIRKQHTHLGLFDTPEEAYAAYCKAAEKLHGEFARLA